MRAVLIGLVVLVVVFTPAFAQGKTSLALFNLTPASIDAIGLDGDLLFSMRKELERSETYQLLSRRQMEEGLYRLGGAQVSDTDKVITYGNGLGVNFILTGTIDIQRATIIVDFKLVDVQNSREAAIWRESFRTQGELVSRAPELVSSLERRIRRALSIQPEIAQSAAALSKFTALGQGEKVVLEWQAGDVGPVFYFNLYRGEDKNGPFEFLESTTESKFVDSKVPQSGTFYYRLDIILETGDEVDGGVVAEASVSKSVVSTDVSAPAILSHQVYVNGVKLDFVPSIANSEKSAEYQVYYRENGGVWAPAVKIPDTGKINYSVTAVNLMAPDKSYEFAVTTVTQSGKESAKSNPVIVTSAPTVTLGSDDLIKTREVGLQWQPIAAEYGVRIQRRPSDNADWQTIGELAAGHNGSYADSAGLEDGLIYQYQLLLFDSLSVSEPSNIVKKETKKLAAPAGFTVSGGVKSAHLYWQEVSDEDVVGYRIYRTQGELTNDTLLDELVDVKGRSKTQFVDGVDNGSPLLDGEEYHYLVVALNAYDGVGFVSETRSANTKPRPSQAGSLAVSIANGQIVIEWPSASESDVQQYRLFRRWNNSSWQEIASLPSTENRYTDGDLKPYAETSYYLVVVDKDGLQSDRSEISAITSPESIALSVSQQGLLRRTELSWSTHHNIDGYNVYRRMKGANQWSLVKTITTPSITRFSDDDKKQLADGVTYEYVITALDGDNETPKSNVVTATTKEVPAPPGDFTAQSGQVKKVTLSWTPINDSDVKGYKIFREEKGRFELLETINGRSKARFTDEGSFFNKLDDGYSYRYKIVAFNTHDANGPLSEVASGQTKPVPTKVTGLTVTESVPNLILEWQPNSEADIDFYQVYRGSSCGSVRKLVAVNMPSYVDTDVSGDRSYCYRVSAVDKDELEGQQSSPVEMTTAPKPGGE